MKQTPVHEQHNPDLLEVIPTTCRKLIEIGCSSGALAREYKKINPGSRYLGVEIDPDYVQLAGRYCDEVFMMSIEAATEEFAVSSRDADCWIFGDSLEHLVDPWRVLAKVRQGLPSNGCVVACIPNAQHWSVQARLCCGEFRYEEAGLLDRTHLRWFTRMTIIEMFQSAGFRIIEGRPRIFDEAKRDQILEVIGRMAKICGADPDLAMSDAMPLQYVIKAIPV
jgi:SAM-dependent methyltransferase